MTQIALANAAGIKQGALSQLETGESRSFRGATLVALARALDVSPEWLAHGEGGMRGDEQPLPPKALAFAREWLKLTPEAREDIERLVKTMVKTSAADQEPVSDKRVAETYGRPKQRKHS